MKKLITILTLAAWCIMCKYVNSQNFQVAEGYALFYYPNGNIASEGTMRQGKPDGYWKTYFESGVLKSEGNRVDFQLEGKWVFYREDGLKMMEINYNGGKKNGLRITYREDETVNENFVMDKKEGLTTYYYADGKIKRVVPFMDELENGNGFEYDKNGNIIVVTEYRRGYVVSRESINRTDLNGLRQGRWKFFYEDGKLQSEGTYRAGKRDGYFKTYDRKGNLTDLKKYSEDIEIVDVPEISKLTIVTEYYPNGKVKSLTTFRENLPDGIRREYDEEGKIISASVFVQGIRLSEGILNEDGTKEGMWKEFFANGSLRAEGRYAGGRKVGAWQFKYESGSLEQKGEYNNEGKLIGKWEWYFENGNLRAEEYYTNGLKDGMATEFDYNGDIISQGEFFEDLEEGPWVYRIDNTKIDGNYRAGLKSGTWKHYYANGRLSFEGGFIDDNPNGKHTYYWENGNKRDEEFYVNGIKEGDWVKYEEDGTPMLVITYRNSREVKYDGVKLKPPFEE